MPMCKALTYKGVDCGNPGTYNGYCWRHRVIFSWRDGWSWSYRR